MDHIMFRAPRRIPSNHESTDVGDMLSASPLFRLPSELKLEVIGYVSSTQMSGMIQLKYPS